METEIPENDDLELQMLKDTVEAKMVVCPQCGKGWLASISQEDIEDGAGKNPFLWCSECLEGRLP